MEKQTAVNSIGEAAIAKWHSSRHHQQKRDTAQDISNRSAIQLKTSATHTWQSWQNSGQWLQQTTAMPGRVSVDQQNMKLLNATLETKFHTPHLFFKILNTCHDTCQDHLVHFSFVQMRHVSMQLWCTSHLRSQTLTKTRGHTCRGQPLRQFFKTCRCQPLRQMRPDSINL